MEKSTAELIVKIYAILAWIGAVFSAIGAIGILFMGSMGGMMYGGFDAMAGGFLAGLGVFLAILLLVVAVIEAFVGWGLWNRQNWARIVSIVFFVLNLLSFPIGTLIGGFGIYAFGFDATVKGLFSGAVSVAAVKASASDAKKAVKKASK